MEGATTIFVDHSCHRQLTSIANALTPEGEPIIATTIQQAIEAIQSQAGNFSIYILGRPNTRELSLMTLSARQIAEQRQQNIALCLIGNCPRDKKAAEVLQIDYKDLAQIYE